MKIFLKLGTVGLVLLGLVFWTVDGYPVEKTQAYVGDYFGVGSYLSTRMYGGSEKNSGAQKLNELSAAWTRIEIVYTTERDFFGDADALAALRTYSPSTRILGLLNWTGDKPSVEDWGNFVEAVVNKFGNDIHTWEILNEPNSRMSAEDYKSYLERARDKIKNHNSTDLVIVGGTSQVDVDFIDKLANLGAWNSFDDLAIHPYMAPDPPEEMQFGRENDIGAIHQMKAAIQRNGGGKGIWVTEFGYQSSGGEDINQARRLVRQTIRMRSEGVVNKIIQYNLRDDTDASWGMTRRDWSSKEIFSLWQRMINELEGLEYNEPVLLADQRLIDGFGANVDGWVTDGSNVKAKLSHGGGMDGGGMQVDYDFYEDSGYAEYKKEYALYGAPSALGVFIDGDGSQNIWRLRVKDAYGETFQYLVGTAPRGWNYYRIILANSKARSSWGGNGNLDYPIRFVSLVLDRNGSKGAKSGISYIDNIFAIHGDADMWGYRFGSRIVAWKEYGGGNTRQVCDKWITVGETPSYTDVNRFTCPKMNDINTQQVFGDQGTDSYPFLSQSFDSQATKIIKKRTRSR